MRAGMAMRGRGSGVRLAALLAIVGALCAPGVTARAQSLEPPRPRQGSYVAVGLLGALELNWDQDEPLGAMGGTALTLRLGELLSPRLGLGVLIGTAGAAHADASATTFDIALEGQLLLDEDFAAHAAVGMGVLYFSGTSDDGEMRGVYGAAYSLGLSYDLFLTNAERSGGWSLVPSLWLRVLPGDTAFGVAGFFGLEASYWTGLPRRQLALPESRAY